MELSELKLDHLSPSSISTYLDSPLRWYDHYVRGLRDGYSHSLHRGLIVHEAIEKRFELGPLAPDEWSWQNALQVAHEMRELEKGDLDFETDIVATSQLLETYWEKYGQHLKPLKVEWPFSLELPYAEKLTSLIGRVDLVHELAGRPAIIDFKTGARKRSWNDVKDDPQAIIYGLALRDIVGVTGDIHMAYHQLIFKTIPEVAILDRIVTEAEMREFEEDFLPGFVRTLEFQIKNDSFYYNPNARFGKRLAA